MAWIFIQDLDTCEHYPNDYVHITGDYPHLKKVGRIAAPVLSDGTYTITLVGEADIDTNNFKSYKRPWKCVDMFPENFKRISWVPCRMSQVQNVTAETHALGAFMEQLESLAEECPNNTAI